MELSLENYCVIIRDRSFYSSDPRTSLFPMTKCCRGERCCYSTCYPDILCKRCRDKILTRGKIRIYSFVKNQYPDFF